MFFFLITSQSTQVMDELNAVTSLHRCAKLYREVWDSLDHWITSKQGNSERMHFWQFPVCQEDGRTPVEVIHQHAGADGRIWIDDTDAATPCQKHFHWEVFWPWWIWQSTLLFVVDHNKSPMRSGASLFWCFSHLTAELHFQTWKSVNGWGFDKGHALVRFFWHIDSTDWHFWKPTANQALGTRPADILPLLCRRTGCFQFQKGTGRSGGIWPWIIIWQLLGKFYFAGSQWNALAHSSHRMCPTASGHWVH